MSETIEAGSTTLLLVGCGKMGGAMLTRWLERGTARRVLVIEPDDRAVAGFAGRIERIAGPESLPAGMAPNVVVLAVKPQSMAATAPAYARLSGPDTVFLSIAAGTTIGALRAFLGPMARVVRAMPNTPAAVGRGMTVLYPGPDVSESQADLCTTLLGAVGEVDWVQDEALMDAVTALSGSGPAYVFYLIECLAEAGVAAGLPRELALRSARATVAGSGELARLSDDPPDVLRRNVTSPGGTTAEALGVLMAPDGLAPLISRAVDAAARRSRELAG